ncbi:ash family protein, partial [Escherichia coli]
KAHNRALAVFLCHEQHYAQIMVGRAGPTSVGPGSLVTGISTPVRLTTNKVVESLGGELLKITKEAAIMATIPTLTQPEIAIVDGQAVTSSLAVANFFSKRHDDVLKKIRTLECSASFTARNFSV